MANISFPPIPHHIPENEDEPPDLCITTKRVNGKHLWNEDAVLDAVLPALAHGYQQMKKNFPVLHKMEISLLLTDDATITDLNKQWRDQEKPTNVLSFSQFSYHQLTDKNILLYGALNVSMMDMHHNDEQATMKHPLGDIVLSYETCAQEAKAGNIDFYHHITHLFVHGFLHLLSYDHEDDKDAIIMQQEEIAILKQCQINNPYD